MAVAEAVKAKPDVNYKVRGDGRRFGEWTRATGAIPRWAVELSGVSADKLVRDGLIEETMDPVVADFQAPPPRDDKDPTPAMAEELNETRKENSRLRSENKGLAANNDALRAKEANQTVALGELTADVAHWRQQAEAHRDAAVRAETLSATNKDRAEQLAAELAAERAERAADKASAKAETTRKK